MCKTITIKAVCPGCSKEISQWSTTQWCREARRKGTCGHCLTGILQEHQEHKGIGCEKCLPEDEKEMVDQDHGKAAENAKYSW